MSNTPAVAKVQIECNTFSGLGSAVTNLALAFCAWRSDVPADRPIRRYRLDAMASTFGTLDYRVGGVSRGLGYLGEPIRALSVLSGFGSCDTRPFSSTA